MTRGIKRSCFWAGLVVLGAIVGGGSQARAVGIGIVVTSGMTQPIGDPLYDYIIDDH